MYAGMALPATVLSIGVVSPHGQRVGGADPELMKQIAPRMASSDHGAGNPWSLGVIRSAENSSTSAASSMPSTTLTSTRVEIVAPRLATGRPAVIAACTRRAGVPTSAWSSWRMAPDMSCQNREGSR